MSRAASAVSGHQETTVSAASIRVSAKFHSCQNLGIVVKNFHSGQTLAYLSRDIVVDRYMQESTFRTVSFVKIKDSAASSEEMPLVCVCIAFVFL